MILERPLAMLGLLLALLPASGLRRIAIVLAVLGVVAPVLYLQPAETVVLLDQSPSAKKGTETAVADFPKQAATRYLAFASQAAWLAKATSRRTDLGKGTNLAGALRKAMKLRPARIVLTTDGLWQTETPPPPVPLFGLYVPESPHVELSLIPPALPALGQTTSVEALVRTNRIQKATLRFFGPAGEKTRQRTIYPGNNTFSYTFPLTGPTRVKAELNTPLGSEKTGVDIRPAGQLELLVFGDPAIEPYLRAQGFAVLTPATLATPIRASAVIIGSGAVAFMPSEQQALLAYLKNGGSLLFTATPKGLFFGGWGKSPLADVLPLRPLDQAGTGLVLVLDVSGSMNEGSPSKLGLAESGALSLVNSARVTDRLGIITFASGPRWIFKPRSMTSQSQKEARSLLLNLSAGGATYMRQAYSEAVDALAALKIKEKQVLILTDGRVADAGGLLELAAKAARDGIYTSTIALGQGADQTLLEAIAKAGGGRYWYVENASTLPRLFLQEAQATFKRSFLEGSFPLTLEPSPITQGLPNPPAIPVLMPAQLAKGATLAIGSGTRPVLALGKQGLGRIAALATDLSLSLKGWPKTPALIGNLLRWLTNTPARPQYLVSRSPSGVKIVVEGSFSNVPVLRFAGKDTPMPPVAPLRYALALPPNAIGDAQVRVGGRLRFQIPLPKASEWPAVDGRARLLALAKESGGGLIKNLQELPKAPDRPLPLAPWLFGAALTIFLLERFMLWRMDQRD